MECPDEFGPFSESTRDMNRDGLAFEEEVDEKERTLNDVHRNFLMSSMLLFAASYKKKSSVKAVQSTNGFGHYDTAAAQEHSNKPSESVKPIPTESLSRPNKEENPKTQSYNETVSSTHKERVEMCSSEASDGNPTGLFSSFDSPEPVDGRIPATDDFQNLKNRTEIKEIKKSTKTVIPVPPLTSYTPEYHDKIAPTRKKHSSSKRHKVIKKESRHLDGRKPKNVSGSWIKLSWSMFYTSASVHIKAVIIFWLLIGNVGCNDPERERMNHESCRLESFQNYQGRGNPLVLAQNGFYCNETESPITTRCFACNLVVSDWQSSSDIPGRHSTHSPNCIVHSSPISPGVDPSIRAHIPTSPGVDPSRQAHTPTSPGVDPSRQAHIPTVQGIEMVEHSAGDTALQGAEGGGDISARAGSSTFFASLVQYLRGRHSLLLDDDENNAQLLLPEPDLYDRPLSYTELGVTLRTEADDSSGSRCRCTILNAQGQRLDEGASSSSQAADLQDGSDDPPEKC